MDYTELDARGLCRSKGKSGGGQQGGLMALNGLIGSDICNQRNVFLGDVKEIVLDVKTGRVAYVRLIIGGLPDWNGKSVAVPWRAFMFDAANHRLVLNMDRIRLAAAANAGIKAWPVLNRPAWSQGLEGDCGIGLD